MVRLLELPLQVGPAVSQLAGVHLRRAGGGSLHHIREADARGERDARLGVCGSIDLWEGCDRDREDLDARAAR